MVRSFTIEKTIPYAQQIKTYMYMYCSRTFNSWVLNVTVNRILTRKNKVITLFPFLFLISSLSYLNSVTIGFVASGFVSCTGLWYSLCHISGNYCSSLSSKWPPPKEGAHLEGQNIKQAPLFNKPNLPPPLHFLKVGIQEKHVSTPTLWEFIRINNYLMIIMR